MALTGRQENFAQLIALEGLSQSEAYRQAYDVSLDSAPRTVWDNASQLVRKTEVAQRIVELRAAGQTQSIASREQILEELAKVGYAASKGAVRPSDKVAALDKMAKVAGLYREEPRDNQPIQITRITVVLDHGDGETTTETQQINPPPQHVIDGESRTLPEDSQA